MGNFIEKIQKVLLPIGGKISSNRYIKALTAGIMGTIPFTMVGAIFTILANPPITAELVKKGGLLATIMGPWFHFATQNKDLLLLPANMTIGLVAVIANYGIALNLAKTYKQNAQTSSIISVIMFLTVCAPATKGVLSSEYLGAMGLFVSMIFAIACIEIIRFCETKNITIRLPKQIPPSVSVSFSAIIPLLLNVIILYGINLILSATVHLSLPAAIMKILTPSINIANSPLGVAVISVFALVLWALGIHGTAIAWTLLGPVLMQAVAHNGELVSAGQAPVFSPSFIYMFISIGGTGSLLALNILLTRSKSKQLSTLGKITIIPNFFGITEPVMYGVPIVMNPILIIPFILAPVVAMVLGYVAYVSGLVPMPYIGIWALMPFGIGEFLKSMSFRTIILSLVILFVSMVIYYPFFKVYEKQLVLAESKTEEK